MSHASSYLIQQKKSDALIVYVNRAGIGEMERILQSEVLPSLLNKNEDSTE